jgi:UDP-2,3-diacylglucosamine hydrolase
VPTYYASDIHIRTDRPDRGARLARFVSRLAPGSDRLILLGDLCDFWFAAREARPGVLGDAGLAALAGFTRAGGALTILPGNHDAWLGPYYSGTLGADFRDTNVIEDTTGGLRIHGLHGHRLGSTSRWKQAMESRAFFESFRAAPGPLARSLAGLLERTNEATMAEVHRRHLEKYRAYVRQVDHPVDLVVFGHVHEVFDLADPAPRLIVLGDWKRQSSYLRVDATGATFVVEPDAA